jgi:hypothetical protein
MEQKCQYPECKDPATTTYQDRAQHLWHVCQKHRDEAAKRRA